MSRFSRPFIALAAVAAAIAVAALSPAASAQEPERERLHREHPATQEGWTETGIELLQGDTAAVTAFGRASWDGGNNASGPNGVEIEWCAPISVAHPIGALLVRAGSNPAVLAEGAMIEGPGRVMLAYNDCQGQHFDNAGTFNVTFSVTRVARPAPTPAPLPADAIAAQQAADEAAAKEAASKGGGLPILPIVLLALLAGIVAGGVFLFRRIAGARRPRFDHSARLESSAWLSPVHLRDLQGEGFPKRALTVGGPDADIDFGVPGIWARLVPTEDGATRIESLGGERVMINDMPLIIGQRLASGHRVKMGVREFMFIEERQPQRPSRREGHAALDKPDPRVAA